ncbi:toxin biosynthesis protein [Sporothrix brasiliensis 5110]|uniref:Toxin biosynthesis protein n=1 Tax=Sporothrix brasiliensis 5110 TaxID=1398154 RepID=A0A0C2J6A7_9PEZI|nr:toxin biosynthesis protein [Sporothrix brasiliensis 5110]KIH92577.1 toxin biosynthesis protein [Sporothrix brasiliensis 5110]
MSQQFFEVKDRVFDGQHIREYSRATAHNQEEILQVCAKQYIPRSNPNPQPGDVTIIAAHANGFVKELYEPLWDDLLALSEKNGFRIRSIWIADVAWQGESGVRNEANLGNDPSWYDHSRDLLQMINTFRREMPRPLVGVGHSFGGSIIANLSLMHPRLLSTLVLLDPVLNFRLVGPAFGSTPLELSAVRREVWPSRANAAASFRRSKFYAAWDPRVLDAWIKHGLRDLPTKRFPDPDAVVGATQSKQDGPGTSADGPPVTLTTTKHQEVFTFLRPLLQGVDVETGRRVFSRQRLPDISNASLSVFGASQLYRPEVPNTAAQLPHLRPGVCYIFGATSNMSTPELRQEKLDLTGVGVGGSGGVAAGRVREVVVEKTGHLVPMDLPTVCAEHAASWIGQELNLWREEERELEAAWWPRGDEAKQTIDAEWRSFIPQKPKPRL